MKIDYKLKRECVEAYKNGMTYRQVYNTIFLPQHKGMSLECFKVKCSEWKRKTYADDMTLEAGTYPEFIPHGATVQVNGNGEVVQAWIKQNADEAELFENLINAIKENTKPVKYNTEKRPYSTRMLEIGLYDMHFGLNNDYSKVLDDLIDVIQQRFYDEINIIIGQDLFHNDDFRGRTAKGTPIEKVDMAKAWNDAKAFWYNVILQAFWHTQTVKITYVKGNHDESISWAFVQMLKVMFPKAIVDDGLKRRKCINWQGCFIGLTHGCETKSNVNDLRGQFTIKFPEQFANSSVREIHCGHLHHEKEADVYGVMIRRLSTANIDDEWSDDSGYVGAHKRFMVFEWEPNKLKSINYIGG